MCIQRLDPPELARPSGFSHAVTATRGATVWLAGQLALGVDGRIVSGGVVEQFEQALSNLLTALRAAGGEPGDLVNLTIYIVDMDDYRYRSSDIGDVWRRLVGTHYPAAAGVAVARLWHDAALVEVQGVAQVPRRQKRLRHPARVAALGDVVRVAVAGGRLSSRRTTSRLS